MTNTLSQQLCKLCGIEPRKEFYSLGLGETKEVEVYPDFTKPENFVRLLFLEIPSECLIMPNYNLSVVIQDFKNIRSIDLFLKELIYYFIFTEHDMGLYDAREYLKQAIRETEWDWG